jgi:hypothetical protein
VAIKCHPNEFIDIELLIYEGHYFVKGFKSIKLNLLVSFENNFRKVLIVLTIIMQKASQIVLKISKICCGVYG